MDDIKIALIIVLSISTCAVFAMFGMNKHNEIMADKGFCKTTIVGVESPVWGKCK